MKQFGRMLVLALMTVGLMVPGLAGTASAQDSSLCDAANASGQGTMVDGYDVVLLTGGAGSQIVLGYGSSTLSGGSGNDILCAWGTGNILDGGSGNDLLIAMDSPGNAFFGGSGNDAMIGYANDTYDGGSGTNGWIELAATGYDLGVEELAGSEGQTFNILGSGFTSDSTASLRVTFVDSEGELIFSIRFPSLGSYPSVVTDSEGNFNTGSNPDLLFPFPGCRSGNQEVGTVHVTATDDATSGVYEETFTRDQTCFE